MAKSDGQKLVERIAEWMGGYLSTGDTELGLVLALWSIGSWVTERFYSWPYLAVTASTKGAGKTRVLELLKPLCQNALLTVNPSPAGVLREIRNTNGKFTLLWDEAEPRTNKFFEEVLN